MRARMLAAATAAALTLTASAEAAVNYTTGPEVNTNPSGSCFSTFFKSAFTKQDGVDPKVGELFYVSLTATFVDSFDCAADFVSSALTLPAGVTPAITADTPMICRRYGPNGSTTVFDSRAQANCPTSLALSGGSYSVRPKSSPVFPDIGGSGGSYWTLGYPLREAQKYTSLQLLVPVKASQALTNASVSHFSCAVSTGCLTSSVAGLTVGVTTGGNGGGGGTGGDGGGGTGAATATTSLAGDLSVGAVGAALPISIASTQPFKILTDISTSSTLNGDVYASGQPCGFPAGLVWSEGGNPFAVDGAFTWLLGAGYDPAASPCFLSPNTLYYYRACALNSAGSLVVTDSCRDSTFRTSAVAISFDAPLDTPAGRPRSDQLIVAAKILGGHFASANVELQAAARGSNDFGRATGTVAQSVTQSVEDVTLPAQTLTGAPNNGSPFSFQPWRVYRLRACTTGACSPGRDVLAGGMYDDQDASGIGQTTATLSAVPAPPWPAGSLTFRLGSAAPASGNGKDLALVATVALPANATATASSTITGLTGLAPATTYFWSACFDHDDPFGVTGPEDCSAVRSFTTASVPAAEMPASSTEPAGTGTGEASGGTVTPGTGTGTALPGTSAVTGGTVGAAPTPEQIGKAAGGGALQTARTPGVKGLTVTLPKTLRIKKAKRRLLVGMLVREAGNVELQLRKGVKRRARARFTVGAPGKLGFSLKLPKGLKPGRYSVSIAFTPKGTTKTGRVSVPLRLR